MPIAIIIALLIGGGASAAAESSLPGDALYPIKVEVNESVRGWLAFSNEAEANLQSKFAQRRLEEAEKLAANDGLNEEQQVRLEERFKIHADKVRARIQKLEEKNTPKAMEIASHLEVSLEAHSKILENMAASFDGDTELKLKNLKVLVLAHKNKISGHSVAHEKELIRIGGGPETQAAAEGKLKATENKLDETRKFIEQHSDRFDAEAKAKAKARLKLAEETLIQGKAKLEAKTYGEAFLLFQKTHNILREVKLLLNAKVEFETEVKGEAESDLHKSRIHEKIKIELGI